MEYHVYNAEGNLHTIVSDPKATLNMRYPDIECTYEVNDEGIVTGNVWIIDTELGEVVRVNRETGDFIGKPLTEVVS